MFGLLHPIFLPPTPVVVGHRGAPSEAAENTPASFTAAVAAGARWVEMDARLTADDTAVVHHDPTLADGRRIVELSDAECRDAGVVSLAEVLTTLPPDVGVDLEIKNFPGDPDHDPTMAVVAACRRELAAHRGGRAVVASSFNPLVLVALAEADDDLARGLLTIGTVLETGIRAAVELGAAGLFCHDSTTGLDADGVDTARQAGLSVMVWTVDDPTRATALATMGVDAVCTNDPRGIVQALAAHGRLRR